MKIVNCHEWNMLLVLCPFNSQKQDSGVPALKSLCCIAYIQIQGAYIDIPDNYRIGNLYMYHCKTPPYIQCIPKIQKDTFNAYTMYQLIKAKIHWDSDMRKNPLLLLAARIAELH